MRRLLVLVSALVVLVTLGPTTVLGQEATPEPGGTALAQTDIRYVIPFGTEGLNAGLTVTDNLTGTCIGDSIAVSDRADAFRCLGEGDQVYDPCFENSFAASDEPGDVACVTDPFGTEVVLLTIADPLPREKDVPPGPGGDPFAPWDLPWALELANGDRCTLLHGTLIVIAGQTAHYGCENGGAVFGEVDHSRPLWTANYLAAGEVASNLVEVVAAWS
jgi:hypothetical protein